MKPGGESATLQLVYTSHASRHFSDHELLNLLKKSRRYNTSRGVTGVLMCHGDFFAQCLEGPVAEVDTLFQQIKKDNRHHSVVVVFEHLTEERVFAEWSMGYTGISSSESIQLATIKWEKVEQHHAETGTASPGFVLLQTLWEEHKNAL